MKGWSTITLAVLVVAEIILVGWHTLNGWRDDKVLAAEREMRAELGDPRAKFTEDQFTGDQTNGQTCGRIETSSRGSERFIVYIGARAPLIDGGLGGGDLSQADFDDAWRSDCLRKGYNPVLASGQAWFAGGDDSSMR